jgi:hypothetical protein
MMPSERQLLNMIFADGAAPNEREAAIALLKRITGKDRSGLVEKYTTSDAKIVGGNDHYRVSWLSEVRLCMDLERNLADEKVKLKATEQALNVARLELEKSNRKISRLEKPNRASGTNIPGVEEKIAPRHFIIDKKTHAILLIEEVCAAYGLALMPTFDLPDIPAGRPYWRPTYAEVFTSICPTCGELLWVNTRYQRWTCLR